MTCAASCETATLPSIILVRRGLPEIAHELDPYGHDLAHAATSTVHELDTRRAPDSILMLLFPDGGKQEGRDEMKG